MKRRFTQSLLKLYQSQAVTLPPPPILTLHAEAYHHISNMISDITRPFKNICIHGRHVDLFLPILCEHNKKFNLSPTDSNITVVDFVRNPDSERLYE